MRKIALMGRPRSGKNYIASKTGIPEYPSGAPLYALVEHFYGPMKKSTPGLIDLLKKFGQWGRACYSSEYPVTAERALMTERVREIGSKIPNFTHVPWKEYGLNEAIWAESVLRLFDHDVRIRKNRVGFIVPDLRDYSDVQFFRDHGVDIYFVLCSEETRRHRIHNLGETDIWKYSWSIMPNVEHQHVGVVEHLNTYISNYFGYGGMPRDLELEKNFDGRIIWNDTQPMTTRRGASLITMDEFLDRVRVSDSHATLEK